jgi:hypothetical protein
MEKNATKKTNASPNDSNKIQFSLTQYVPGYPNIVDAAGNYFKSLNQAKQGGQSTQDYFDSINKTSDFWNWMATESESNNNAYSPGVDPDGNPILMSSNGNVDMRMGTFYRESATGDGHTADESNPPVVGIATIQTGNRTSSVSRYVTFGLGLASAPVNMILTRALFNDLISPIYSNMKTFVNNMSTTMRDATSVEGASIDPEEASAEPRNAASEETELIEGDLAAEEGAEYLAMDWASVGLEAAGLGALIAVPFIASMLGHQMTNSVEVHNLTDYDLIWSIDKLIHGKTSVAPSGQDDAENIIPKMGYNEDQWGDKTTVNVAYAADFQFVNSNDYSSIGYVLSFTPKGGHNAIKAMVSIPWAGQNTIWAGQSNDSSDKIYDEYSQPTAKNYGQVSYTSVVDDLKVTISINKLKGETSGQYFYANAIIIEKNS